MLDRYLFCEQTLDDDLEPPAAPEIEWNGVVMALQLVEELMRVENFRVIVQWLPSHVGIGGNETADTLANQGRNQQ
ncbi:hypothetical protein PoB_000531500 [Plakobranchus ocellatus]|uniref:RNase H type-1 domain-containing protein n=1 Tax=Plakobranchus ocellatus TaxID=259542 RepID=A0AAV3Y7N9_9GAST|nr:hypothetical protein PoB_000531500 [Plakobranchus ocellatus]